MEWIDRLQKMSDAATPEPWFSWEGDDGLCMSAVGVSVTEQTGRKFIYDADWERSAMVAGCLVQSELHVSVGDSRWSENAILIAEMRNNLAELIRLARIGLVVESNEGR